MVDQLRKRTSLESVRPSGLGRIFTTSMASPCMLHSGRPAPSQAVKRRNERVGIVMDLRISEAWRSAGGVWKAISSRIVLAQVK